MACILLMNSAVRVHDSQSYRKMDVTRARINRILELREILMSFQTGFNLLSAAVVCAILESISSLEPSSVITEPRYLKLVTVSSFCPFTLISVPLVLFVISLVFSALCIQVSVPIPDAQLKTSGHLWWHKSCFLKNFFIPDTQLKPLVSYGDTGVNLLGI